jgi:hypothetical protein
VKESFKAKLWVNAAPVDLNPFVEAFLSRTVAGAVSSLKGAEDIQNLELYLQHGEVKVVVNGDELPLTPFPNDVIANTITGLVSTLKDVDKVESLRINVMAP